MIVRVGVVANEPSWLDRLDRLFAGEGAVLTTLDGLPEVPSNGKLDAIDVLVVEGTVESASKLARELSAQSGPDLVVIGDGLGPEERAALTEAGAALVVSPEWSDEDIGRALMPLVRLRSKTIPLPPPGPAPDTLVSSPSMVGLLDLGRRVARGDSSLLILGETGSGKEWLARKIHAASGRADGPFVAVNCGAIPEGLAESELFGHVRGAFTGAVRARRGHFEMAHGGTLFLDEVGDLSEAVQVRLLRVLQERYFQPVGSERPVPVDVRVISATNRSLEAAVERGAFRKDLYYRLAVVTCSVPPLRERAEDVESLVHEYTRHFAAQLGRSVAGFTPEALGVLRGYGWPGNIRELVNVIERAVLLGTGPWLGVEDLPVALREGGADPERAPIATSPEPGANQPPPPFAVARDEAIQEFERVYLGTLLRATRGRVGEAAVLAEMSPRTLFNKLRRHQIRKEEFRG